MLLWLRKNDLTSLIEEVRVFRVMGAASRGSPPSLVSNLPHGGARHGLRNKVGDHQPYTTPTKGLRSKSGIFEGVVYEVSEPETAARCTPPTGLGVRCSAWLLCGARFVGFDREVKTARDRCKISARRRKTIDKCEVGARLVRRRTLVGSAKLGD